MARVSFALCVLALVVATAAATRHWNHAGQAYKGDLIGNDVTGLCGEANSTSGYFNIEGGKNKNYFFWYFQSRNDPSTDPVILWMTGGPGCSSELAMLFENGPCSANADGKTTTNNPYSWNTKANLVYIDQPVGVGFSYGDASDADHNESMVAEDMYHFLHEFYEAFDLGDRPLYIFGESYGGHYAPATAYRVGKSLNLQGLAVGNGLTDPLVQYEYYPDMGYTFAQQKLGKPVLTKVQYDIMKAGWPTCQKMIQECQNKVSSCASAQAFCNELMIAPYEAHGMNPYDIRKPCGSNPLCYDMSNVTKFLANPDVLSAIGVKDITWQSCNYTVNAAFSDDWMRDFQTKVSGLLANNTRVLIYAGDVDFICNWIGNKHWTLALDWAGNAAYNNATDAGWNVNSQEAGLLRTAQGFSFLQIYNAGHMVPHDQPAVALEMVNQFLSNSL
ncbi:uncharacterized protein MONBRDRAFT_38492 [Monosiga brevicollis MX1]|uniref:Carboxypeptidase n=1 Tax=Monosiga brevicollis TaxID=81824 RepID=A9V864_MONBE|nr:uncharacterized protein MONBRDRAFT_38492 [Monosiga brevicollis MX1]EDQ86217.1 predicted protein [Monosiga brevicollis MX1]|eukprot:XP_001748887.1 hypothetical protein [Monosiga brevicollis MX1]